MQRADRIAEILGEWQERRDAGRGLSQEEVIAAHPDLAEELRAQFAFLGQLDRAVSDDVDLPEGAPSEIGDFRIIREIGRGGMGVVYEAEQVSMQRRVALKVLSLAIGGAPHVVKRFEREARAAGMLHHTNIVPIYAMGRHAGHWFYAMELVEGRTLGEVLSALERSEDPQSEESLSQFTPDAKTTSATGTGSYFVRVAAMFAAVAEALQLAHHEGVIHRDVKPSNLLLDAEGVLKIVDFGLAQQIGADGPSITMTGDLLGTPLYMSPEQALAKRVSVDHRTDVYSLGATLYEVLTFRPPFDGKNLAELLAQITTKEPPVPRRVNQRVPRDLQTIVMKAMEKDRDQRYDTAQALAEDLRRFAEGASVRARPIGATGRAWRRVKRHKVRSVLAASLIVALGAASLFALSLKREATQRRDLEYRQLLGQGQAAWGASAAAFEDRLPEAHAAREILDRAVALDPDRPEAYLLRALAPGAPLEDRLADLETAGRHGASTRSCGLLRAWFVDQAVPPEEATPDESWSPLDLFCLAGTRGREGRSDEALALLAQILERDDARPAVRYLAYRMRVRVRLARREAAAALEDLLAIQRAGEDDVGVRIRIASVWRTLGRERLAEDGFRRELERVSADGGSPRSWRRLARACKVSEEWGSLREATTAGLEHHADDFELLLFASLAETWLGNADEALSKAKSALALRPDDHGAHEQHGFALYRAGRPDDALRAYEKAIEIEPNCAVPHGQRGNILLFQGRTDEALGAYDKALELNPRAPHALCSRASILLQLGRADEAKEALARALEIAPGLEDDVTVISIRADLVKASDPEAALGLYERALQKSPDDRQAQCQKAGLLWTLGRNEEALAYLAPLIAKEPNAYFLQWHRMSALHQLRRSQETIEVCDLLLARGLPSFAERRASGYASLDHEGAGNLANTHRTRADALLGLGRTDEALAAYEHSLAALPTAVAHLNKGVALTRAGRAKEAGDAYRAALALEPEHFGGHLNLAGWLCDVAREPKEARKHFEKAVALQPDSAMAHYGLGNALMQLEDYTAAVAAFDQALRHEPNHGGIHHNRARALMKLGRHRESWEGFQRAIDAGEPSLLALNQLAWAHATEPDLEDRDVKKAVAYARRLVKARPEYCNGWNTLGTALFAAGEYAESVKALRRSMELEGGDVAWNHLFMAMARHELGQDDARSWYEKGVRWIGENPTTDARDAELLERFRAQAEALLGDQVASRK